MTSLKLEGIIDWDMSQVVPFQVAVCLLLLTKTTHHAAWIELYAVDRWYFVEMFRQQELEKFRSKWMSRLLETCHQQQFFQMALDMPFVHQEYGKRKCGRSVEEVLAAVKELDLSWSRGGIIKEPWRSVRRANSLWS